MAQRKYLVMSVENYLILNRNSKDIRYEYLDGDVSMLTGGSPDHSIIFANLTGTIKGPLKGSQCRVYNSDVQLKLSEKRYVFPQYHGQLRYARPEPERNDTLPPRRRRSALSNYRSDRQRQKGSLLSSMSNYTGIHAGSLANNSCCTTRLRRELLLPLIGIGFSS